MVEGKITVCGGALPFNDFGDGSQLNLCYSYDPQFDEWRVKDNMRAPRAFAQGVIVPNYGFWVTGGFNRPSSPFPEIVEYSSEVLSSIGDGWKYGSSSPKPIYGHCMVQIDSSRTLIAG